MKTVYVVTSGSYSDYGVDAIFTTKKKAEEYIKSFPDSDCNGIGEWDIDPDCALYSKQGRSPYSVKMHYDGSVDSVFKMNPARSHDRTKFQIWKRSTAPAYRHAPHLYPDLLSGIAWATDETHAVKIANEHRAQMIASGEFKPPVTAEGGAE